MNQYFCFIFYLFRLAQQVLVSHFSKFTENNLKNQSYYSHSVTIKPYTKKSCLIVQTAFLSITCVSEPLPELLDVAGRGGPAGREADRRVVGVDAVPQVKGDVLREFFQPAVFKYHELLVGG